MSDSEHDIIVSDDADANSNEPSSGTDLFDDDVQAADEADRIAGYDEEFELDPQAELEALERPTTAAQRSAAEREMAARDALASINDPRYALPAAVLAFDMQQGLNLPLREHGSDASTTGPNFNFSQLRRATAAALGAYPSDGDTHVDSSSKHTQEHSDLLSSELYKRFGARPRQFVLYDFNKAVPRERNFRVVCTEFLAQPNNFAVREQIVDRIGLFFATFTESGRAPAAPLVQALGASTQQESLKHLDHTLGGAAGGVDDLKYVAKLRDHFANQSKSSIEVDIINVLAFSIDLCRLVLYNPAQVLPLFDEALLRFIVKVEPNYLFVNKDVTCRVFIPEITPAIVSDMRARYSRSKLSGATSTRQSCQAEDGGPAPAPGAARAGSAGSAGSTGGASDAGATGATGANDTTGAYGARSADPSSSGDAGGSAPPQGSTAQAGTTTQKNLDATDIAEDEIVHILRDLVEKSWSMLTADCLSKLIRVTGVVSSRGARMPRLAVVVLKCRQCSAELGPFNLTNKSVLTTKESFESDSQSLAFLPRRCINEACKSTKLTISTQGTLYSDYQKLTLQEPPSRLAAGRLPERREVIVTQDLIDSVLPGDMVTVTGTYTHVYDAALNKRLGHPVFSTMLQANHFAKTNELNLAFSPQDRQAFDDLARRYQGEDLDAMLFRSVAPSIHGLVSVKQALLLTLVGGVSHFIDRAARQEAFRTRGDLHMLLIGDPGQAKSQLLKYVQSVAPKCVFTSGKGASAAGLTVSVKKSSTTGEFYLQSGALVLANEGTCIVDEIDKMNDVDRVALHQAMEQQVISVAKAGIIATLPARTGIIAAANPVTGQYVSSLPLSSNTNIGEALLSRFDLVCVMKDVVDYDNDRRLARFIVEQHAKAHVYVKDKVAELLRCKDDIYALQGLIWSTDVSDNATRPTISTTHRSTDAGSTNMHGTGNLSISGPDARPAEPADPAGPDRLDRQPGRPADEAPQDGMATPSVMSSVPQDQPSDQAAGGPSATKEYLQASLDAGIRRYKAILQNLTEYLGPYASSVLGDNILSEGGDTPQALPPHWPVKRVVDYLLHDGKTNVVLPQSFLRKYVYYARYIEPSLSEGSVRVIRDFYTHVRGLSIGGATPVTNRQIGTLFRLAEAHAKLQLRRAMSIDDTHFAIRLFTTLYIPQQKAVVQRRIEGAMRKLESSEAEKYSAIMSVLYDCVQGMRLYHINKNEIVERVRITVAHLSSECAAHNIEIGTAFFKSRQFLDHYQLETLPSGETVAIIKLFDV